MSSCFGPGGGDSVPPPLAATTHSYYNREQRITADGYCKQYRKTKKVKKQENFVHGACWHVVNFTHAKTLFFPILEIGACYIYFVHAQP